MTEKNQSEIRLYTILQVIEILQLSDSTIRRLIDGGKLKTMRIGKTIRISNHAIDEFIAGLEQK